MWSSTEDVRFLGLRLTATMTVLRVTDGLLVHSPVALTEARRAAVDALGPVTHLYAPNLYHHGWIAEWASAYPSARIHAPAGLAAKQRELRIDRAHDLEPEPAFEGILDEQRIEGFRLHETVLLYRPARTLIVADLVHDVGRPTHAWTKTYTKAMGFYDRVALSRMLRWTAFSDRKRARQSVDALLARDFDQIIVGHGEPIAFGAREALEAAYRWLPSTK